MKNILSRALHADIRQNKLIATFAIAISIFIFLSAIKLFAFNLDFYNSEFKKYNPDVENPSEIASNLIYFLENKNADESYVNKFSEEEISHLKDVKSLMQKGIIAWYLSIILILISIIPLYFLNKKKFLRNLAVSLGAGGILTLILSILAYIFLSDFSSAFVSFHNLFFAGNWMFSSDSLLIKLFPEQFWIDVSYKIMKIVLISANILILAAVILFITTKKGGKK